MALKLLVGVDPDIPVGILFKCLPIVVLDHTAILVANFYKVVHKDTTFDVFHNLSLEVQIP